jgi:hypothetical protein
LDTSGCFPEEKRLGHEVFIHIHLVPMLKMPRATSPLWHTSSRRRIVIGKQLVMWVTSEFDSDCTSSLKRI